MSCGPIDVDGAPLGLLPIPELPTPSPLPVPPTARTHSAPRKRRRVAVRDDVIPRLYGLDRPTGRGIPPGSAPENNNARNVSVNPEHAGAAGAAAASALRRPPPPHGAPSLLEHLDALLPESEGILRPGDSQEFADLLTSSLAVTESTAPSPPPGGCHRTLHEILMLVLEDLFRRDGRPSHVLAFGYRLTGDSDDTGAPVAGHPSITSLYPNPAITFLKRKPWALIHRRLGDAAMIHLLLHTAIFVEIDPASTAQNYIQVSGVLAVFHKGRVDAKKKAKGGTLQSGRPVQRLLHDMSLGDKLRSTHPLIALTQGQGPISNRSAKRLLFFIFGQGECQQSGGGKIRGEPRLKSRFVSMIPLAKQLLTRFKRCNKQALLRRHCPIPDEVTAHCSQTDTSVPGPAKSNQVVPDLHAPAEASRINFSAGELESSGACKELPPGYSGPCPPQPPPNRNAHFTPCSQVRAFVVAVLNAVIPPEMWGAASNRDQIFRYVGTLVHLTKFERFTVDPVVESLKVNACRWLHSGPPDRAPAVEHQHRRLLLQQWVHWLFDSFIVPIIRAHFYVTESSANKNRLFFFRKSLWKTMCGTALSALQDEMYEAVDFKEATRELEKQKLGFSYVRMIPKGSGMRCLVNMSRKPAGTGKSEKFQASINQKLQNLFHILTFEKSRDPAKLGASVFGMDDVYVRLSAFARKLNAGCADGAPRPRLYFVSVDVKKCFDSVRHDRLLEIIDTALQEEEYVVRKFTTVMAKGDKLQRMFRKNVDAATGSMPRLKEFATVCAAPYRNAVLGDQVAVAYETKEDLLALLREHVLGNFVKAGGQFYRQACGIAQGSVLSSLLCSYFYGDLEKNVLRAGRDITAASELMMRQIDDFLMITTDRVAATKFLRTMFEGVEAYGCNISRAKTKTNFESRRSVADTGRLLEGDEVATPSTLSAGGSAPVRDPSSASTASLSSQSTASLPDETAAAEPVAPADLWMPWCGVLINTSSLETRVDIARYEGNYIRDTITAEVAKNPGESILDKLVFFLKLKLHPLLIDEELNSRYGASLNLYQIFRLCAMKLHCHARLLPPKRRARGNTGFFMRVIGELMHYPQKRVQSMLKQDLFSHVQFTLSRAEVNYLAVHAFLSTFRPRQTEYAPLIVQLDAKRDQLVAKLAPERVRDLRRVLQAPQNTAFTRILL